MLREAYSKRLADEKAEEELRRLRLHKRYVPGEALASSKAGGSSSGGPSESVESSDFEVMRPENIPTLLSNTFRFLEVHFLVAQAVALLARWVGRQAGDTSSPPDRQKPAVIDDAGVLGWRR